MAASHARAARQRGRDPSRRAAVGAGRDGDARRSPCHAVMDTVDRRRLHALRRVRRPAWRTAMLLATLGANARTWTSPPLAPGSYFVQVAAANFSGSGPLSNPVEFSVGVTAVPDAPTELESIVADDVVKLRWGAPTTGPAPAGYDVEAAAAGATNFTTITRVLLPQLAVTQVPAGAWDVRVRAVTAGGRSAPSNTVSVNVAACTTAPSAPRQLVSAGATSF